MHTKQASPTGLACFLVYSVTINRVMPLVSR